MATSVELSSSPASLDKGSSSFMGSSPTFSPSSDKRFWSNLRGRVDTLLDNRKPIDQSLPTQLNDGARQRAKRLKEDTMLLMRGFDSVAHSLSQLSNNLENALQGARDLARPPTLTEIFHCTLEKAKSKEEEKPKKEDGDEDNEEAGEESGDGKRGLKRKLDPQECSEDQADDRQKENGQGSKEFGNFNKARNLAISMATKASALARELKSLKSDLCFMQDRSTLLEEENRRLRDGFANDIRPEEDDLVRLQMEALLAEKSRLANENANLNRENQSLRQLVQYHQLTSQDLSASYENLIRGMCLDFSSPEDLAREDTYEDDDVKEGREATQADICNLSRNLDECYEDERQ